jgi:hypothetical protein
MLISSFLVDYSALLKPDVLIALERLPDGGLSFFLGFLQKGSLEVSPLADLRPAGMAGDDTRIFRIVWNDELVAAALRATRLHFTLTAHEDLRR